MSDKVEIHQKIGRNLAHLRSHLGLAQWDVADILGVSFQQVQRYEAGADPIPAERLVRLQTVLDVSLDQLVADQPNWEVNADEGSQLRGPTGMLIAEDAF